MLCLVFMRKSDIKYANAQLRNVTPIRPPTGKYLDGYQAKDDGSGLAVKKPGSGGAAGVSGSAPDSTPAGDEKASAGAGDEKHGAGGEKKSRKKGVSFAPGGDDKPPASDSAIGIAAAGSTEVKAEADKKAAEDAAAAEAAAKAAAEAAPEYTHEDGNDFDSEDEGDDDTAPAGGLAMGKGGAAAAAAAKAAKAKWNGRKRNGFVLQGAHIEHLLQFLQRMTAFALTKYQDAHFAKITAASTYRFHPVLVPSSLPSLTLSYVSDNRNRRSS